MKTSTSFQKGDKRINRKGRLPGTFNPSDAIKAALQEVDPITRKQNGIAIIHAAVKDALGGNKDARQWLFDRGYGKALERIEANIPQGPMIAFPESFDG